MSLPIMSAASSGSGGGFFSPSDWTKAVGDIGSWFSQNETNVSRDLSQSGYGHETSTEGLAIDVPGVMKYINDLLKDPSIGLANIVGQDRAAGLYGSSSAAYSTNDLLDKIAGTVAQLTAKKTKTNVFGQVSGAKESTESEKPGFISELFGGIRNIFSDARLKTNIVRIGTTPGGIPIYDYKFGGIIPERGVLAQDLLTLLPEAVSVHSSGYYMVDYSKVH